MEFTGIPSKYFHGIFLFRLLLLIYYTFDRTFFNSFFVDCFVEDCGGLCACEREDGLGGSGSCWLIVDECCWKLES